MTWKDEIRKNIFEKDPEDMTAFMNVSPRMKQEAKKKQDSLKSGFKNNQENYETVLEAIERLMGLKDSITRGMKESEDEQINEDEMRKIAMALNKAAQQLESYY